MEIIALEGKSNAGKTTVINVVYQLMLEMGYTQIPGRFQDLDNNDFLDVLTNENQTVGIVSQGDYARGKYAVKNHLATLESFGCDKAICACSTDKSSEIKAAILAYPNTIVAKLPQPVVALQRIDNHKDAKTLISVSSV